MRRPSRRCQRREFAGFGRGPGCIPFSALESGLLCFPFHSGSIRISAALGARALDGLDPGIFASFDAHCLKRHDASSEKGDFRIDHLSAKIGFEDTPHWLEIMERISTGEMLTTPPIRALFLRTRGRKGSIGSDRR